MDFVEGEILLFDKPYDWTSFDLVNKIRVMLRNYLGIKKIKVGHAGTLDPLATGLMIICTGKATKKIESLSGLDKEYIATIKLGETTPTYDLESVVNKQFPTNHITESFLRNRLGRFKGEIDQMPPIYSAIKIKGNKAYDLARRGHDVELKSRKIEITELEVLNWEGTLLKIRVRCSKGTYIRSLAHDIGLALDSGAYLADLERTQIGPYHIKEAMDLDIFEKNLHQQATKP